MKFLEFVKKHYAFFDDFEQINCFNIDLELEHINEALNGEQPLTLYLGFNPVTYHGDIVLLTKNGSTF